MKINIERGAYNRAESAKYLGMAENTFVKLLESGEVPFRKVGRRLLISKLALDNYLNSCADKVQETKKAPTVAGTQADVFDKNIVPQEVQKVKPIKHIDDVKSAKGIKDCNHESDYKTLGKKEKKILKKWIETNFTKAKKEFASSSYGLKHEFENDTGIYITNGQFKGAMLDLEFYPVDSYELNWGFKIKRVKAKK